MATSSLDIDETTVFPTVDQFADALSSEAHWYNLGMFLQVPTHELNRIGLEYRSEGTLRCMIEVYNSLESMGKVPSWEFLSKALRKMNNGSLAHEIYNNYVLKPSSQIAATSEGSNESPSDNRQAAAVGLPIVTGGSAVPLSPGQLPTQLTESSGPQVDVPLEIKEQYDDLTCEFSKIIVHTHDAMKKSKVDIDSMQQPLRTQYELQPLRSNEANFEMVWDIVLKYCSILNIRILSILVDTFLSNKKPLRRELTAYNDQIEIFKTSAEMKHLVHLLREQQPPGEGRKLMRLRLRTFWSKIEFKKFEDVLKEVLLVEYRYTSHMTVSKGCICVCWLVPDIHTNKLITLQPLEFIRIIGVISLHIGSDVIYNNEGEGCETIEAAMLQAIELKNTRAIELLLVMGCNPEVATYNGDNAVTTIVNIRESKKSSVDHVCIIGHNEHVEAIVDPSSKPAECSSCSINKKMNKRLHQQMDASQETIKINAHAVQNPRSPF